MPFYLGAVAWTIIYDSIYAFQDRQFDKKLNLKSTAIEMENNPKKILTTLATFSISMFALGGYNAGFGSLYFEWLSLCAAHYAWQITKLDIQDPKRCWQLFSSNRWFGLLLLVTIICGKGTQI